MYFSSRKTPKIFKITMNVSLQKEAITTTILNTTYLSLYHCVSISDLKLFIKLDLGKRFMNDSQKRVGILLYDQNHPKVTCSPSLTTFSTSLSTFSWLCSIFFALCTNLIATKQLLCCEQLNNCQRRQYMVMD